MPRKSPSTPPRPRAARRKAPLAAPASPAPCFSVDTTEVPALPDCYFVGSGSSPSTAVCTYDALGRLRSSTSPPGQPLFFPPQPAQAKAPADGATRRPCSPRKKKSR